MIKTQEVDEMESHMATKENEEAICEKCEEIVISKKVGEQFYCNDCHKYLKRKKLKNENSIR